MRERKEAVTLKATTWELESWRDAARRVKRDVPASSSSRATPRPAIWELDRQRRPDFVMIREEEKRKLGALLKAHLPKVHQSPIYGPRYLQGNLQKAVDEVYHFLNWHGEE
jgi:hypothetical protein